MEEQAAGIEARHQRADVARGIVLMLAAALCTAVDTGLIRIIGETLHAFEIAFFRNLFSLLLIMPWLLRAGLGSLRSDRMPLHALRAVLKLVALTSFFYAVTIMPLADVTAIAFTTPLFVAVGAVLFMGERSLRRRWVAIVFGFVGALVVLRPGDQVFEPLMLTAVLAALGNATIALILKFLSVREPLHVIVGLNLLLSVPLALVIALPFWVWPSWWVLALLCVDGALGLCAQTALARSLALADASILMPVDFIRLPLVVLIGWAAFGEAVDLWIGVGGAMILASIFYLTRVESRVAPVAAPPAIGPQP